MSAEIVFIVISLYFLVLLGISWITSRKSDTATFFTGNRQSPWYLVAFGMIGASLSGVTFISVPGEVGRSSFSYFQMVLGYLPGYWFVILILLPLYYRLKLVSIYEYLEKRFGEKSYKTGAIFFIISRIIGASFRLFLVATVLHLGFFQAFEIPFEITVAVTLALIWLYTFRAGIKTIVWTDTLQTFFMLATVIVSIFIIAKEMNLDTSGIIETVKNHSYSDIFVWDLNAGNNFFKQFFAGAFIVITMTGLDQDMMQKNLTCRNLKDAQKNMFWFSLILLPVNLLFLSLGVLLYVYSASMGIELPKTTDQLYPLLALNHFSIAAGVLFLLGIIAAAFSSADSAITSLTTSVCVDILKLDVRKNSKQVRKTKRIVHLIIASIIFVVIIVFKMQNDTSVISAVFKAAGYTYGPLLGLFAFGLFTRRKATDNLILPIAILSPILTYIINYNSEKWFFGYKFGFEILILNGLIMFLGLFFISFNKLSKKN